MRYECCAQGTTCNDLPAPVDQGRRFEPPQQIKGRSLVGTEGAKPLEALETLQLTLAKKMQKLHLTLNYNFVNFVD